MHENPIYTIGYGHRSFGEYLNILKSLGIQRLVDVRTSPYSKVSPEYTRSYLNNALRKAGIEYVFMGGELGGLPGSEECYTEGKVDYSKVERQEFYLRGISRLEKYHDGKPIALMCTEIKPEECHRSKLIGQTLVKRGYTVQHVDENSDLCNHKDVIARLTSGQINLFEPRFTSKKKYKIT